MADHPIAEERTAIRQVHEPLGPIDIAIGAIDQFEPETAEAVRIPDAALEILIPGLKTVEIQGVMARQFRVQAEMERPIRPEVELLQVLLHLRIQPLRLAPLWLLELLNLDQHKSVLGVKGPRWLPGKILKLRNLVPEPGAVDPGDRPVIQSFHPGTVEAEVSTGALMPEQCVADPIGFSTPRGTSDQPGLMHSQKFQIDSLPDPTSRMGTILSMADQMMHGHSSRDRHGAPLGSGINIKKNLSGLWWLEIELV